MADVVEHDLNEKQLRFATEYLRDQNGTRAAVAAGYSEKTAHAQASRLLKHVKVRAYIDERMAVVINKLEVTQERIVEEYARIAFSDIRKAVRWKSSILAADVDPDDDSGNPEPAGVHVNDVQFLDSDEIDGDTALAIAEIGKDSRGGLKLKMHDKLKALDALARWMGMFDGKGGNVGPGDDQASDLIDDRAAARRVAHLLLRAANAPPALPE
jgi:phage terminase small subunit